MNNPKRNTMLRKRDLRTFCQIKETKEMRVPHLSNNWKRNSRKPKTISKQQRRTGLKRKLNGNRSSRNLNRNTQKKRRSLKKCCKQKETIAIKAPH